MSRIKVTSTATGNAECDLRAAPASVAAAFADPALVFEIRPGGSFPALVNGAIPMKAVAHASTDPGANISVISASATQGASLACVLGAFISAPLANTVAVYVGFASTVTTGTGIELQPGDREFVPGITNTSQLWARTGTATQALHVLAC